MKEFRRRYVSFFLRSLLRMVCKVDVGEYLDFLRSHPDPHILAINHINFLDVPMLVAFAYPRFVTGLVNAEAWSNRFMAFLFDSYDAIPIDRNGSYFQTFREVHRRLNRGQTVAIAPEGKRSKTGILSRGKAGVVQLSLVTGAPILPLGIVGSEGFWENLKRGRRTPFTFRVGRPLRFKTAGRPQKEEQEAMLTELMGEIAGLLPEWMRGEYARMPGVSTRYVDFL